MKDYYKSTNSGIIDLYPSQEYYPLYSGENVIGIISVSKDEDAFKTYTLSPSFANDMNKIQKITNQFAIIYKDTSFIIVTANEIESFGEIIQDLTLEKINEIRANIKNVRYNEKRKVPLFPQVRAQKYYNLPVKSQTDTYDCWAAAAASIHEKKSGKYTSVADVKDDWGFSTAIPTDWAVSRFNSVWGYDSYKTTGSTAISDLMILVLNNKHSMMLFSGPTSGHFCALNCYYSPTSTMSFMDPAKEGSNYGQIRTSSSENSQGHLTFTSNGNTWTLSEQAVINP